MLDKLPLEILTIIFSYINIYSFIELLQTSKLFYSLKHIECYGKKNIKYINMDTVYRNSYELNIIKTYNKDYNDIYKHCHINYCLYNNIYTLNIDNFKDIFQIQNIITNNVNIKIQYNAVKKFMRNKKKYEYLKYLQFYPGEGYIYFNINGEFPLYINIYNDNLLYFKKIYIQTNLLNMEKFKKLGIHGKFMSKEFVLDEPIDYKEGMYMLKQIIDCFNITL